MKLQPARKAGLEGKLLATSERVFRFKLDRAQLLREVAMRWSGAAGKAARWLVGSACLMALPIGVAGQEKHVAGEYVCTEARVAGKTMPCKAAPLSLKSDGRFELQGREGEYLVSGNWVELNGKVLKSRAKIEPGHRIVFRFHNKSGLCEMVYERRVVELGKTELS
jgi:hypothetical protein